MAVTRRKFLSLTALTGIGVGLGIPWLAKAEKPMVEHIAAAMEMTKQAEIEPDGLTLEKIAEAKKILLRDKGRIFYVTPDEPSTLKWIADDGQEMVTEG